MFGFSVCFFFLRFLNGVHESTAPLFAVTAQKSFEFFVNAFPHPVPTGWGMGGMGGGGDKHAGQICLIDRVLLDDWQKNHTDARSCRTRELTLPAV